ncbi:Rmf/CrpP family protein [Streptomyces hygroscopicus]|uniref:Rmf/CrpP family protein n=1 Tax=Streptomyces hygroscopicus TaxID=1912 RepID=UPI003D767DF0
MTACPYPTSDLRRSAWVRGYTMPETLTSVADSDTGGQAEQPTGEAGDLRSGQCGAPTTPVGLPAAINRCEVLQSPIHVSGGKLGDRTSVWTITERSPSKWRETRTWP